MTATRTRKTWPPPATTPEGAREATRAYGQCAADHSQPVPTMAEVVRINQTAQIKVTRTGMPDRYFDKPEDLTRAGIDLATLRLRGFTAEDFD